MTRMSIRSSCAGLSSRRARSVRKTPSSRRRKNTFPDAPHPQINARTLGHLDLDGFRLRLLGFRETHGEHAVLVVSRHLAPIRILRKREAPHEAPVGTFDPMMLVPGGFLLVFPFAGNRQDIVLHRELDLLLLHVR